MIGNIVAGTFVVLVFVGWVFIMGTRYPSRNLKEKIGDDAILLHFTNWYDDQIWTCVKSIKDGIGIMGGRAHNILVESKSGERILICGYSKIAVGDKLRSRPATKDEMESGVWVSPADRYISFERFPHVQDHPV